MKAAPTLIAVVVACILVAGCGIKQIEVPRESQNGPIEAVAALRNTGFRVDLIVNGKWAAPLDVEDRLSDGRYCRVARQRPSHGLAAKDSAVRLEVVCR